MRDIGTQRLINVCPVAASHQPGLLGKPDYGGDIMTFVARRWRSMFGGRRRNIRFSQPVKNLVQVGAVRVSTIFVTMEMSVFREFHQCSKEHESHPSCRPLGCSLGIVECFPIDPPTAASYHREWQTKTPMRTNPDG